MADRVVDAALAYLMRKDRMQHPDGSSDGKRWYPSDDEYQDCCRSIRSPSAAWPWSLMVHCRTAGHVAQLYGVSEVDVRRVARAIGSGDVGELAEDPRPQVRRWLVLLPHVSVSTLQLLVTDEDETVRTSALLRWAEVAGTEALAEDPRPQVRRWLVLLSQLSVVTLQRLATDEDESIRMAARDRLRDMAIEVLAQ